LALTGGIRITARRRLPGRTLNLGDAVTPEVAAAWSEVYWVMAFALTNMERGLCSARGVRPEIVWRQ
jgi:hypothetical protein